MEEYKTDAELIDDLENEIVDAGSLRQWARKHDMSPSYVCDATTGRRRITERLAAALGFEPARLWQRIKHKEKRP